MATKKNYDKYNMFSSSAKKEEEEKPENRSVAARIFERRGQALKQEGTTSPDYGMSPAEVFRQRKELLKTATQRTPEQTDILRSDREQAAKEYANIQRKKFQNSFYGDMSPNTFMDSASSEELSLLGKVERERGNLSNIAQEYAKARNTRNAVSQNNLYESAGSEQLSQMGRSAKEASRNRQKELYQKQKSLNQTGFIDKENNFIRYDSLERQQPDFHEMVEKGRNEDNIFNSNSTFGPMDYFNKEKRMVLQGSQYNFTKMTDTEKNLYYYLNGKYGAQAATNYIESISEELNRRNVEDVQLNASTLSKEHPILGTILDAGIAAAGSGAYPVLLGRQAMQGITGDYEDIDPNDPLFGAPIITEAIRSGISDNETLKNIIPNEGLRNFLTGTGLSMTENIARLPLGYYGLAAAGGGAGLSGTRNAVLQGGSNDQAISLGIANAAAEAFFEKFSLEGLQSLKVAPGRSVREFLKNVGKQAVTEGSEEVFTEIANTISDEAIMGNLSQYNRDYNDYIQNGLDSTTAKKSALIDFLKNLGVAGAGGALSGGMLGGGSQVLGNIQMSQYGKSIADDYNDYANGIDINPDSYTLDSDYQEALELQRIAEEYADQRAQGKNISDWDKAEYDLRFRQFQQNIIENNAYETTDTTFQNEHQDENKYIVEQSQPETEKAEYEPYMRPEQQMDTNQKSDSAIETQIQHTEEELDVWAEVYGKEGQQAFKSAYDNETALPSYYRAFAQAYNAGRYNMEPKGPGRVEAAIILSPEQFEAAYKAGAHDRNAEIGYDPETYEMRGMTTGVPKEGGIGKATDNATESQRLVSSHVGKLTGLQIDLVDSIENENAIASYERGRIKLSVNADNFNASVSHELTHFIQDYASDAYQIYQDHTVKALAESKGVDLETLVADYISTYEAEGKELSRAEAMDEIVADATQEFLNDSKFMMDIASQNISLGQKIVDFFTDIIEALKELVKTGSTRKASMGLKENMEYFESCRRGWMNALEEAGERYKSGMEKTEAGSMEKFVLAKPEAVTSENIEENYQKVRDMEPVSELSGNEFEKGESDLISQVTRYFDSIGKVNNDVVGDIHLNRESVKSDIAHGIGRAKAITFASVPAVLEKGHVLDYQKNWKGRNYDSAVIGAKVKIREGKYAGEYYEAVIVKVAEDNKMYVHEVYTQKLEGDIPFKTPSFPQSGSRSGKSPSIYSIFGKLLGVNENQKGIKYQMENVDETVTQRRLEAIIYENQTLRDANNLLQKQLELTSKNEVRQEDVGKVAKKLLKDYNSTYKQETLHKNLDRLYEYIRSAEQVDGMEVTEAATSIAKSILKQSRHVDTELTQMYKDLRNQVKNTKIRISDQDKADLASAGGYNEFRKRYFGRMKLGNDGISIDSLYQELNAQHPELFPESVTHPAEQLMAIASALEQTDSYVENPYHANMDEMAYIVGQEIVQSYFDVRRERPTFADKKAAEIERVKREYSRKMSDYKDKLKQAYKDAEKNIYRESQKKMEDLKNTYNNLSQARQREMKDYYMQKMDELRNQKNQKLAAMQSRNREQVRKVYDSQRARDAKRSIIKEAKTLQGWLLKPTDAKHIPESLRTTVAGFLSNIDFSADEQNNNGIPTLRTQEWEKVKKEFDIIIKNGGAVKEEGGSYAYMEIDPDMLARIDDITQKVEGIDKLDNLDTYTLEEIKKVVISMKKAITEVNSVKSNKKYGNLSMLADDMFSDLEIRRNKTEYTGLIGKPDKLLNYDMLDPQTMFEQLGPAAKTTYNALRDGLDKKTLKLKEAQDYIKKVMSENNITAKDIKKWSGREARTERFKVFGGEIELTIADIMSLYELNKRPAARGHIYDRNGGIKPEARNTGMRLENGKLIPGHIEKSHRAVRVTESDVKMITDILSPEQKRIADSIQEFMGDVVAGWGNEVTMEMYGYNKFTAGQYFPIDVDKSNLPTKEGEAMNQMGTIKNMGITKSTQEHAHKPIIIGDIFDVYSRQVDKMSSYNAYVIPLSDLQKVYNYIDMRTEKGSIKEQIGRTFGKAGNDYIHKLLLDINGSIKTETGFIDSMLSNMKAASVAGNLRVAIQQPTAYLRASMEISPIYLAMGAKTMTRKGQWELICQYAPIAQWKDWGFYRMDTSRQMKDIMFGTDSKKQQFVNWTMTAAEVGDKVAWNRLWRACEYECMDRNPELKQGSEEFYHQVGERFSEIIDKTQVVDSVLHRTQIMRSQNMGTKMATSFMAEPLKTYDMLYRAVMDVRAGKDKSKRRAARAAAVFVATNVATALAAAAVDAARDDDRKKGYKEKYKEAAWENFKDGMNIINNIPYAKDAVSVFAGYSQTRADTAAYQDIYYAYKKLGKVYSGDSELTPQYVALYTAEMSSKLLGLPIRSISRDAQAISDTLMHGLGKKSDDYTWLKQKYDIGSKENLDLYVGMMIEAHRSNDTELQQRIKDDLNAAKIDNDTISNKIKSLIKGELISRDYIDPRIDAAAQAKMEMDLDTYEASIEELMAEGYAGKIIGSAIESRLTQLTTGENIDWEAEAAMEPDELYGDILTGKSEEDEEWSLYGTGDIINAIEMFDNTTKSLETFNRISKSIVDSKVKSGKKEKDAIGTLKSVITRKYKAEWIAAYKKRDRKSYEAIQNKLKFLKVNGKVLYNSEDWGNWLKDAKKA
uniref:hypothetical protein n=1 Tax=Enterocloster aldenensis TaxID=358742 RepID=UPI0035664246